MTHTVTTRTRASRLATIAAVLLIAAGLALPAFADRSMIKDLFFILTMLTLAQYWNLLAGYGGLVSVGQQAFVGLGAYGLFGAAIVWGIGPSEEARSTATGKVRRYSCKNASSDTGVIAA